MTTTDNLRMDQDGASVFFLKSFITFFTKYSYHHYSDNAMTMDGPSPLRLPGATTTATRQMTVGTAQTMGRYRQMMGGDGAMTCIIIWAHSTFFFYFIHFYSTN